MAYAPDWLRQEQEIRIMDFLNSIGNSPHFTDYEEPLMEVINFAKDPKHKYNEKIMRQYVEVTEKYDRFRGHDVMTVAPEFARIRDALN
jgi:hemerythrin